MASLTVTLPERFSTANKQLPPLDHYTVLGLEPSATPEAITASYHRLKFQLCTDDKPIEDAANAFHAVERAYKTLSNPHDRRYYDFMREDICLTSMAQSSSSSSAQRNSVTSPDSLQTLDQVHEFEDWVHRRFTRWTSRKREADGRVRWMTAEIKTLGQTIDFLCRFIISDIEAVKHCYPFSLVQWNCAMSEAAKASHNILARKIIDSKTTRFSIKSSELRVWKAELARLTQEEPMIMSRNAQDRETIDVRKKQLRAEVQAENERERQLPAERQETEHFPAENQDMEQYVTLLRTELDQRNAATRSHNVVEEAVRCHWEGDSWETVQKAMMEDVKSLIARHDDW